MSRFLHRYVLFLTFAVFALIVAGGLVTSTRSGLSVPDWPLSYGQVFPPMIGGIRFEHTHRVIAGFVGLLTLALMLLLFKAEKRSWVKKLGLVAFLAVVLQAVLGGLTVIYLLPRPVSVAHACLAQTFFALIAAMALFTSSEWLAGGRVESEKAGSIRRLTATTTFFIYLQLVLGALVRHGDKNDPVINYHYGVAFLILMHALFIVSKVGREPETSRRFFRHAAVLGFMVIAQVFLGLGSFIVTRQIETPSPTLAQVFFTTAHHGLGALILATSFLLMLRSFRFLQKPSTATKPLAAAPAYPPVGR